MTKDRGRRALHPDAVVFQGFCFGAPLQSMKRALHQNEALAFLLKGLIGAARRRRLAYVIRNWMSWRDRRGTAQLIEELRTTPEIGKEVNPTCRSL
jgi:hypothetical protein